MNKAQEYMNCVTGLLQTIMDKEAQNIEAAARPIRTARAWSPWLSATGTASVPTPSA